MAEIKVQFRSLVDEVDQEENHLYNHTNAVPKLTKNKKWWAKMVIYTLFVLICQSGATLLARLYYNEGGNTILLEALLQTIGFPILIPFTLYFSSRNLFKSNNIPINEKQPSFFTKSSIYVILGLLQAAANVLYSIGLQNLPLSTFSLISTTQLAFNALFSFFLNAQKITFLTLNSLILLTISSALLIFNTNSEHSGNHWDEKQFFIGFSSTLVASALFSLVLSLTQLSFNKILKRVTFDTVLNMIIYQSIVETCVVLMALFLSREWNDLSKEMGNFELGIGSYFMILVLIAVAWQVCSIGAVGLIFEASSLFSNVISTVGLPVMPILAAIFFREKIDVVKVVSILLAFGGFALYIYQHHLEDCEIGRGDGVVEKAANSSLVENCISNEIAV